MNKCHEFTFSCKTFFNSGKSLKVKVVNVKLFGDTRFLSDSADTFSCMSFYTASFVQSRIRRRHQMTIYSWRSFFFFHLLGSGRTTARPERRNGPTWEKQHPTIHPHNPAGHWKLPQWLKCKKNNQKNTSDITSFSNVFLLYHIENSIFVPSS